MKTLCGISIAAFSLLLCGAAQAAGDLPHIGYVYPAGGQAGTTFEVKVGGEKIYGCESACVSGQGVSVQVLDAKEPTDPKKRKPKRDRSVIDEIATLKITIAKDAEPGDRDLRLATSKGLSNKLTFQVGQLLEVVEAEPDSVKEKAVKIPSLPATLNGQIMPGDVDFFKFHAKKGQRLVIQTDVRTLIPYIADAVPGWFQADLTLFDGSGAEVAHSSDFRYSQDPVLFHSVESDGDFYLSVRDSIYRGREDFVYRVKVGELPFITHIYPLGARQDKEPVEVSLYGVNLPCSSIKVDVSKTAPSVQFLQVERDGLLSNKVPFAVGTLFESSWVRGCDSVERAQRITPPVVINGTIEKPDELHFFSFSGKKGEELSFEVFARRLGSPLDSELELFNPKGERIASNDDFKDPGEAMLTHHADSRIVQKIPEDGVYILRLADMQGRGGPDCSYRLRIGQQEQDFELRAEPASVTLGKGSSATLSLRAIRRGGFRGEIKLSMKGEANGLFLSGGTIPEGADSIVATLSARPDASSGFRAPLLEGSASVNGKILTRRAVPSEDLMQAFIYHHFVPSDEQTAIIGAPAPYALLAKLPEGSSRLELQLGKELSFPVEAIRQPGYGEAIKLQLQNPPKGVYIAKGVIEAGENSCIVKVRADPKTAPANFKGNLILTGMMVLDRPDESQPQPKAEPAKDGQKTEAKSGDSKAVSEAKDSKAPQTPAPAQPEKKVKKERIAALAPALPFATLPPEPQKAKNDAKDAKKK